MFCRLSQDCAWEVMPSTEPRLCMGSYAKPLSPENETICLKGTRKTLFKLHEVSPTAQKETCWNRPEFEQRPTAVHARNISPLPTHKLLSKINFPKQINVQQHSNVTQSKILHRKRLKMESWERNQLHAVFPADDLRLQNKTKQNKQKKKDGFLHQHILKANADNKKEKLQYKKGSNCSHHGVQ